MATVTPTKTNTKTTSAKAKIEAARRFKQAYHTAMLFKQVSDPTRLQVIFLLSEGEYQVGTLCDQFKMTQPAVSHHLAMLRHGGIITANRQGKNNFYRLTDNGERPFKLVKGVVV